MNLSQLLEPETLRQVLLVIGIIVGTLLVARLLGYVLIDLVFLRLAKRSRTTLDDMIAKAARRPLYFIIVLLGFNVAIGQLGSISDSLQAVLQDFLLVMVITLGAYTAYRLLMDVLTWYAEGVAQRTQSGFDEHFVGFIKRVLQIVLVALVAIMVLGTLDVDVTGLVAGLGVASLAIALAAQALLEDTFAGFTLMVDRPFVVGDRILLPKSIGGLYGAWGDVLDIRLRATTVRSTDGVVLVVPNSLLTKDVMVNFSHSDSPPLRVRIRVGLEREWSNVERGMDILRAILNDHPDVSHDPRQPEVIVRELRDYDVLIEARYYVETPPQMRHVNSAVQSQLLQAYEAEGVTMSYPTEIALAELQKQ